MQMHRMHIMVISPFSGTEKNYGKGVIIEVIKRYG